MQPTTPPPEFVGALQYAQTGNFSQAKAALDQLGDPKENPFPPVQSLYGAICVQLGEFQLAATILSHYCDRFPQDLDARLNLARAWVRSGQYDTATEVYLDLVRQPKFATLAIDELCSGLLASGQRQALADAFQRLPEASQKRPLVFACHAFLDTENLHPDEWCAKYARLSVDESIWLALIRALAVDQSRKYLRAWLERGEPEHIRRERTAVAAAHSLVSAGNFSIALEIARKAIEHGANSANIYELAGIAAGKRDDVKAAQRYLDEAVKRDGGSPDRLLNRAAVLSTSTEPRILESCANDALSVLDAQPESPLAHDVLCVVRAKQNRYEQAIEYGQAAVARAPQRMDFVLHLAQALESSGDFREAAKVLQDTLDSGNGSAQLRRQLGICELKMGSTNEALVDLRKALALAPSDQRSIAHLQLAQTLLNIEAAEGPGLIKRVELEIPDGFESMAEFNSALAHDIRNHSLLRWEPVGLAARNGALTSDLTADRTKAIRAFEALLRQEIEARMREAIAFDSKGARPPPFVENAWQGDYELNIWATLTKSEGNIDTHIHEDSWLSGAYYVELPPSVQEDGSTHAGWIEFGRPYQDLPALAEENIQLIKPEPGLLLLFPSYLFHRTIPHSGEGERISISFDVSKVA